jgi:hypothetical protein
VSVRVQLDFVQTQGGAHCNYNAAVIGTGGTQSMTPPVEDHGGCFAGCVAHGNKPIRCHGDNGDALECKTGTRGYISTMIIPVVTHDIILGHSIFFIVLGKKVFVFCSHQFWN